MGQEVHRFIDLSLDALSEREVDDFINKLMERQGVAERLKELEISKEDIEFLFDIESKILERLEKEKRKVIEEMERLSKKRAPLKVYSAKYPFPPMPCFFEMDT